jgi:hypothetical protein
MNNTDSGSNIEQSAKNEGAKIEASAPPKRGGLKRFAYFVLALDSWKYSFTTPFKRTGAVLNASVAMIPRLFIQTDQIAPAVTVKQLSLTVRKSFTAFCIQLMFAVFFSVITIFFTSSPIPIVINGLVTLIFIFQAFINLMIYQKAKTQSNPVRG